MNSLPLAVTGAALAASLAACGTQSAGTATPPVLQLTDASAGGESGTAQSAAVAAGAGSSGFTLRATLPTSTPQPSPVWHLPRATAQSAARVGTALGLSGAPTPVHGGWVIRDAGKLFAVREAGTWSWGMDCSPQAPVRQENLDVMCASASAGGGVAVAPAPAGGAGSPAPIPSPVPLPKGLSAPQVTAVAAPLLDRLGWAGSIVDASAGAPIATAIAHRSLGGMPTADWTTTLAFDADGKLVDGTGWVGEPARGRPYPLIAASRAYEQLLAEPRVVPEMCAVRKDGKPGCAPIPPTVITGATLGLALRHDLDKPLLVPAWLFSVEGSDQPLAVVAVDPRWLKPPATVLPRPLPAQSVNPAGPAAGPS